MSNYIPYMIDDVKKASEEKKFTVVSLFAGGGGSSTGYRLAGGNVIAINEFVEEAIRTYSENFPDTTIIPGDVKDLTEEKFWKATGLVPGELDILDGSPPCSAFSVSGKREKNWKGSVKEDVVEFRIKGGLKIPIVKRTVQDGVKKYSEDKVVEAIEDLFLEFVRIADFVKPKVIVAENVKGITFGGAKEKLDQFLAAFRGIGYRVTYRVMNAADYGVAQARERTIFVCIREDVYKAIGMNDLTINRVFPKKTTPDHIPLSSALEGVVNDPEQEEELLDFLQNSFQKKWAELLPFNPPRRVKPSDDEFVHLNPKRSFFNMIRPAPSRPCPTITQQGNQKGVSGVLHPAVNRKFTIPELKRIMSMPDDFVLTGDFNKQAERLGRMVAPKMMAELAKSIYVKVLEPYEVAISMKKVKDEIGYDF